MSRSRSLLGLAVVAALLAGAPFVKPTRGQAPPPNRRTQFVLLGIDSTPSDHRPLEHTGFYHLFRAINRGRPDGARPNSLTLFIATGGLQLSPSRPRFQRNPETRPFVGLLPRNMPVIRYARNLRSIRDKARNVAELSQYGVEIASHSVRHGRGAGYTPEQWRFEMRDHQRILELVGIPRPAGFRAPFLEESPGMFEAMAAQGMRYDASRPGPARWPSRHEATGIWRFELPSVQLPGGGSALFFDDNMITLLRAAARGRGLSGAAAQDWMDDAFVNAATAAFRRRYTSQRAPFLVSGHGNFRRATIRFMRRVCELPDVRCASFSEATDYMDAHPELAGVAD